MKKLICLLFSFSFAFLSQAQVLPDRSPITNISEFSDQSIALIDSSRAIWKELRDDILLDTSILSRTEIDTILRICSSLDSALNHCLLGEQQLIQKEAQLFNGALARATSSEQDTTLSRARSVFFKRKRVLADTILSLQDSLSRAIELYFVNSSDQRASSSIDYKNLLEQFSQIQLSPHSFDAGISYQSRSVWRGIDQNNGKGAYSLMATYRHEVGLFALAQALGIQGRSPFIDQISLGIGFERDLFDNFLASLAYTRYFYSDSSIQVRSSINSDVSLRISYSLSWITSSASIIWAISNENDDFICSWELSKPFAFRDFLSGEILLIPSLSAEYGTVSSVSAVARRLRSGKVVRNVTESSPFVLTNYNLSLSAVYTYHSFSFVPELIYSIPINVPSLSMTRSNLLGSGSSSSVFNLNAPSLFYVSTSFYVSF